MTVRLVIEHASHPQRETSRTWEGGELVIGRGADAGWQLDDPDQFLSRRHVIVSAIGGVPHVTDASRGGLFVDGAATPLGPGNSRPLEDGMRLRLGDFVLRVEMQAAARTAGAESARKPTMQFEFGPAEVPAAAPRPSALPTPFGAARPDPFAPAAAPAMRAPPRPLDMDDPFALDLRATPAAPQAAPMAPRPASPFDAPPFDAPAVAPRAGGPFDPAPGTGARGGGLFDPLPPARAEAAADPRAAEGPAAARPVPASSPFAVPEPPAAGPGGGAAPKRSYFFDDVPAAEEAPARPADPFALGAGFRPVAPEVEPPPESSAVDDLVARFAPDPVVRAPDSAPRVAPAAEVDPFGPGPAAPAPVASVRPDPVAVAPPAPPPVAPGVAQADLYAAFLRGAGLPPGTAPADAERAMEDAGRHFRALVDGLMHMLRARALEKQKVRVAVTVMASANVNPLKTLPTAEDGVAALLAPKGPGYLAPGPAIDGAFRDLADHQMRTWTALQAALRRMIDRFDPAEIEAEMEQAGRMKALLAGGRKALLWQLYEERYREIAEAAEERFLGEVGADFRDAYEGQRRDKE
ncbi:MAG: type VI secretion system-associated FHA domain protein TagH [Rhodobacteraceae bacterium]|jgi:type VI secretion system FHA domain protein|nr:type VI secretion system-associated FHA domain protein TagH [Paracoccaceae bacterium]